jgi:branched-chain amino acid transport system ATP-binding protein
MILQVEAINTYYGKSHILQDISLNVNAGEVVALLGRNGVGKTTTLRSIMGLTPPRSGEIRFKGEEAAGSPAYVMSKKGIAYMPDDLRIFPDLTCEENLEIARRLSGRSGYWNRGRVEALFPVLGERTRQMGLNLSGGEKKMLSMGRTLMANPDLILLDEPSEGLAPMVVANLVEGRRCAGFHQVTWNPGRSSALQSSTGIYFLKLETGGHRETRRLLMLR